MPPQSPGPVVDEVPLGLSPAHMKISSPESVQALQAEALDANDARLRAIAAEFGSDTNLLVSAINDRSMTVQSIKASKFDSNGSGASQAGAAGGSTQGAASIPTHIEVEAIAMWNANPGLHAGFQGDRCAFVSNYHESIKLWNETPELRANFSGGMTAFQALYRNDKSMALEEIARVKAKR